MASTSDMVRISETTAAMFTLLSDGEWHVFEKIKREGALTHLAINYEDALERGKRLKTRLKNPSTVTHDDDLAMVGAVDRARNNLMIACRGRRLLRRGNKIRMYADYRKQWLTFTTREPLLWAFPMGDNETSSKIRTFAGIREDVAFAAAPIEIRDRVLFRLNYPLPEQTFNAWRSQTWSMTYEPESDLYRIDGPSHHGRTIEASIREWAETNGYAVRDLRVVKGMHKRDLGALEPHFLAAMTEFYVPFMIKRLRNRWYTVARQYDSLDDIRQQVGEWVLTAIREYNEQKNVPFGAFLQQRVSCRIHDLGRRDLGRAMADFENNKSKTVSMLTVQLQRDPTTKEIVTHMGMTMADYRAAQANIDARYKLRSTFSLNEPDDGAVSAAREPATDYDAGTSVLENAESARLTAAMVGACQPKDGPVNLVAFGYMYYSQYAGMSKTEIAKLMGVSAQTLNTAVEKIRPALQKTLAA